MQSIRIAEDARGMRDLALSQERVKLEATARLDKEQEAQNDN